MYLSGGLLAMDANETHIYLDVNLIICGCTTHHFSDGSNTPADSLLGFQLSLPGSTLRHTHESQPF